MPFSTTVQIARSPDHVVVALGSSVTVTYTISGSGTVTATLVRTDGAAPVSLTCDGSSHTVTFTPAWSQLYFISAADDNGTVLDRLEIIVQWSLTATDPTASPTISTVRNGLWTDTNPATSPWPSGTLPGVNDIVSCSHTVKVNARLDGSSHVLQCARFVNESGGNLRIWNDNGETARLWLTDYHGKAGSALDMNSTYTAGTVAVLVLRNRPFHANDTSGNSPDGYANFWNALFVDGGDLAMRGTTVTPFIRTAGALTAGDTWIDLYYPATGWKAGQVIIIPDTRSYRPGPGGVSITELTELAIIRGVGPDGSSNPDQRVYLMRPLAYDHPAALDVDGSMSVRPWDRDGNENPEPLTPHILCPNKTCIILTEDPTGITGSNMEGNPRAHIMMKGGGRVDCRDALIGHASGRCNLDDIQAAAGGILGPGYYPQYQRCFPVLTFDLHGPSGGLGYDADVDEFEFDPDDERNVFSLDGPSHRFINCDTLEPMVDAGAGDSQHLGTTPLAVGGFAHLFTCYGLYKGCMAFNFSGTCWLVSDGSVLRNVFTHNLVCRSDGRGTRNDSNNLMFGGAGWAWGSYNNWVRNNVHAAAGGFSNNKEIYAHAWIAVRSEDAPAWAPNFQGASQLDAGNRTAVDNALVPVLMWDNLEAYGSAVHIGIYLLGIDQTQTKIQFANQLLTRETAWGFYSTASLRYGHYRVIKDRWFVRTDYHAGTEFESGTDYTTDETTYLRWDVEGVDIFLGQSADVGIQFNDDPDVPDPGGVGRIMIRGGRYRVRKLINMGYYHGTQSASAYPGHHYIVGGDRSTGSPADAVTLIDPPDYTAVYVYNSFLVFADLPNDLGWNLVSPYVTEVNRVGGRNYDVYYDVQDPGTSLKQNCDNVGGVPASIVLGRVWGAPESGMTNQSCHDKYIPFPTHHADNWASDVILADFNGILKGSIDSTTPGRCWGGELTPASATVMPWLGGDRGNASILADDVGASGSGRTARITQLHPGALAGRRYGSFSGRASVPPSRTKRITQLHPGALAGRRYGSFSGRSSAVVTTRFRKTFSAVGKTGQRQAFRSAGGL